MKMEIVADSLVEGHWFRSLHPTLKDVPITAMRARGANSKAVDELIVYDRPDIILLADGAGRLVVEKTREVPTGHNIGQRLARLVRAAELGVPVIKFFPFDAMKHGTHANVCNLNARVLEAFQKMTDIHKVPVLAVNWPVDKYWELVDGGAEDTVVRELLAEFIVTGLQHNGPRFRAQLNFMAAEYVKRVDARPQYRKPPPSVVVHKTAKLVLPGLSNAPPAVNAKLRSYLESVVYTIVMTEANARREDPYTGMQFLYDYTMCRVGPKPREKARALVLHFPQIRQAVWHSLNPNDVMRKSSNWYLTATALVFKDGAEIVNA